MHTCVTDLNVLVAYSNPQDKDPQDKDYPLHIPTGWDWIKVDLNSGARGDYLYFVFEKCDQDPPITGIQILTDDEAAPPGYQKIPVDLNRKTPKHEHALFAAVTRAGGSAIEDIKVTHWKETPLDPPPGYQRINCDLNKGAEGDHIYLDYKLTQDYTPAP